MTIAQEYRRHELAQVEDGDQGQMAEIPPMRRDWFGHALQVLAIVIPLGGGLFFWSQAITEHFGEQSARIATVQTEQDALRHELDREEQRRSAYESTITSKLDAIAAAVSAGAVDLALLRKDLHR